MIRGAFIFCCGLASGVLVYDTALERTEHKPRTIVYGEPMKLTNPVSCDATVDGKCYRRGMK